MASWNDLVGNSKKSKFAVMGWLSKKRDKESGPQAKPSLLKRLNGGWQERYFWLAAGSDDLMYFECDKSFKSFIANDSKCQAKGTIDLTDGASLFVKERKASGAVRFTLTTEARGGLKLLAANEAEFDRWAAAIEPFCKKAGNDMRRDALMTWSERPMTKEPEPPKGTSYRRAHTPVCGLAHAPRNAAGAEAGTLGTGASAFSARPRSLIPSCATPGKSSNSSSSSWLAWLRRACRPRQVTAGRERRAPWSLRTMTRWSLHAKGSPSFETRRRAWNLR